MSNHTTGTSPNPTGGSAMKWLIVRLGTRLIVRLGVCLVVLGTIICAGSIEVEPFSLGALIGFIMVLAGGAATIPARSAEDEEHL